MATKTHHEGDEGEEDDYYNGITYLEPLPPASMIPSINPILFLQSQFDTILDICIEYHMKNPRKSFWFPIGFPMFEVNEDGIVDKNNTLFKYINTYNIRSLTLPIRPIEEFYKQCPIIINDKEKNNVERCQTSLIYLIENIDIECRFKNSIYQIKPGTYFNLQTKTVFKFLTNPKKIEDFLYEAVICYNCADAINSKKCLTFYADILCAEYSYEGPDVECIFNFTTPREYISLMCCDNNGIQNICDKDIIDDIYIFFINNIIEILINICNIANNLSLLELSFSDFKPNNLAFNIITKQIILIDAEFIYPFGYKQTGNIYNEKEIVYKLLQRYEQTPPEWFVGDVLDEKSTVYGLQFTIMKILMWLQSKCRYFSKDLRTLRMLNNILYNSTFVSLNMNARKIYCPQKRPSIVEYIKFFKNIEI